VPWILDSGALFHMTHDSNSLCSLSPSSTSLFVTTIDGTSNHILSHGTLHSSCVMVPFGSHVPDLNLQLMSISQITYHDCRIILESDSCFI
jgi:hypothetical protein